MMSQIGKKNRGSEWRKWDLQVHTPFSHLNNGFGSDFDEYVKILFKNAIEKDVSVIGITDYFCIEGYKKIVQDYLQKEEKLKELFSDEEIERIKSIKLLPNVEFRLDTLVNENRVNFHVIFSDAVSISDIEENFLHELDFVYQGSPQSADEKWKLKLMNLELLGKKLKREHQEFSQDSDLFIGMKCAVVNHSQITEILTNKKSKFEGMYLQCVPADEDLSAISWNGQDHNVRKIYIQKADVLVSSNSSTITWGLGRKHLTIDAFIGEFKSIKPCIWGSDCHDYDKMFEPNDQRYTWIKADATFEGLKQLIYEPTSRVFIGATAPNHSPNVIDSFTFAIPAGAHVGGDQFCFADSTQTFYLNPHFNCFVGGRGTGKSTILNFFGLRSTYPDSSRAFWKGLDPKGFNLEDPSVFSTDGTEIFEFLGQSEVETFARDRARFTQAIYDRANSRSGNELAQFEQSIIEHQSDLDTIIQHIVDLRRLESERQEKQKEKRTLERGLSVASSEEYTALAADITSKAKELQSLREWREKVESLHGSLRDLVQGAEREDGTDFDSWSLDNLDEAQETNESANNEMVSNQCVSAYEQAYADALAKVSEIGATLEQKNFVGALQEESRLEKLIYEQEGNAKEILEKVGLSAESVEQIKSAPQKITFLEGQLTKLDEQIDGKKKAIKKREVILEDLKGTKEQYEKRLTKILQPLRDILEKQFNENEGRDIKKIELEYSFSDKVAWEVLAEELYGRFKNYYGDGERSNEVCRYICENPDIFGGDDFSAVQTLLQKEEAGKLKYVAFLNGVFSDEKNFQIFCSIRDKHLYDVTKYKLIKVKYGQREIENASFGQRCTAVIVILLLFGNYPLIIDEPEAHLDSSLIANYLVPLLKSQKVHRQIIFSTHNANFVVNGDAEKIFVLEVPDKQTEFIETTIENLEHREKLLKLEGGEEAFLARKNKYHFK